MFTHIFVFLVGIGIVLGTLYSAIRSLVLPRATPDPLTNLEFSTFRFLFRLISQRARSYTTRDRVMAYLTPVALLTLVPVWFVLLTLGYMCIYWALGLGSWYESFRLSGSSLLTLGFSTSRIPLVTVFIFSEATIGLMLVALLIAYLPTIYAAFSRREVTVTMLEVRAGNPPSAVEMILRFHRIQGLEQLTEQWQIWEKWFSDIQESHTSFAALCIRAGYLALSHIAGYFRIPYNPDLQYPTDKISISREEYDETCQRLSNAGIPLKEDREQAWRDFAGWRVNYDTVLLALANLTMAPDANWTGDR